MPTMNPDLGDVAAYARMYEDDFMGDLVAAKAAVTESFRREFIWARAAKLEASIKYWAKKYARLYPDTLMRIDKHRWGLKGFDPNLAQYLFIPFDNTGRRGKDGASKILKEMYESTNHGAGAQS